MGVSFKSHGNFSKTEKLLDFIMTDKMYLNHLERYAQKGVDALAMYTPIDSGLTAKSWEYEIVKTEGGYTIVWNNNNINEHVNIAIILQYGHATRSGTWVEGVDYINPALKPIFEKLANDIWEGVTKV